MNKLKSIGTIVASVLQFIFATLCLAGAAEICRVVVYSSNTGMLASAFLFVTAAGMLTAWNYWWDRATETLEQL